jgi:hypothetical protein
MALCIAPVFHASLDGHVFEAVIHTKKNAIRGLVTNPIRDSSIMLFRTRPSTPSTWRDVLHVAFAYNLSNLALTFGRHTPSHDWYDSLSHKLCMEHMAVSKQLQRSCGSGGLTPCWCGSTGKILESCEHHVAPWAATKGGHACDHVLMLCPGEPHPFKGLCKYQLSHTRAPDTKRHEKHHNTHRTNPRFKTWKHRDLHSRRHHVNTFIEEKVRKSKAAREKRKA